MSPTCSPLTYPSGAQDSEKTVGIVENVIFIFFFTTMFSSPLMQDTISTPTLNLSCANAFNMDKSKIVWSGKKLCIMGCENIYSKISCLIGLCHLNINTKFKS